MSTPKLPPLPEPIAFRTRPDATVKWLYGDSETKAPLCEIRERLFSAAQMNDHYLNGYTDALAAIAEHGVPGGWELVREDTLKLAIGFAIPAMERDRDSPSNSAWMVEAADRNIAAVRSMLASAPPAPQASGYGPKLMPQVSGFEQAAVVQQEPVAKVAVSADGKHRTVVPDSIEFFELPDETRLYTHPAKQAKPQPRKFTLDDIRKAIDAKEDPASGKVDPHQLLEALLGCDPGPAAVEHIPSDDSEGGLTE